MKISGGGTTAASIIDACNNGVLRGLVKPVLMIASKSSAGGMQKALDRGMQQKDVMVIRRKHYPTSEDFGEAILKECWKRGVNFIGQYGWMVLTPENVINTYINMIVNQHPGPLDPGRTGFGGKGWYGRRVHCARIYFVREVQRDFWTEAISQRVDPEYDKGALLYKKVVPIDNINATVSLEELTTQLQQKVLPEEHKVQIETLRKAALGELKDLPARGQPLVLPGEEEIFEEAKRVAFQLFPKG